jgi:hypothetical protein
MQVSARAARVRALVGAVVEAKRMLLSSRWSGSSTRARILFYPRRPHPFAAVYKICHLLGYRIITSTRAEFDVAVYWSDETWRSGSGSALPPAAGVGSVVNGWCTDISKTAVDSAFDAAFGYSLAVDPRRYAGRCVVKSDRNATHDGRIVECPVSEMAPGKVYQRIVNNLVSPGIVEDIRVPVFGDRVPFVYVKYRAENDRFSNLNDEARMVAASECLTTAEIQGLLRVCRTMGLDYGELDVLRDRDDGRVYLVDVNATPWGPPNHLRREHRPVALAAMARCFDEVFLQHQRVDQAGMRPTNRGSEC